MTAERAGDRTEILLDEGMIDAAVASIGGSASHWTADAVLLRLMEAAQASYSDWVIGLAERKAGAIMDGGSAGRYAEAAAWLARAAQAYDAAGRIDDWGIRIEGLIETHRRKYKLRPLLEALPCDA